MSKRFKVISIFARAFLSIMLFVEGYLFGSGSTYAIFIGGFLLLCDMYVSRQRDEICFHLGRINACDTIEKGRE